MRFVFNVVKELRLFAELNFARQRLAVVLEFQSNAFFPLDDLVGGQIERLEGETSLLYVQMITCFV